ncbi:MAG: TonB-dependent receptor [Gallionella sp.]|nr:TonB-dependent receptor [Gallionella sp.]
MRMILRNLLLLYITGLSLVTEVAQAVDEDAFLGQIRPALEQSMGQGQSALWALSDVATQYQPLHPAPALQAALQAQHESRFLDALMLLDEAGKSVQAGADTPTGANTMDEINLLRASFLLQGHQSRQAVEILAPLLGKTQHAADAYALTAMAQLQQGQQQKALDAAQQARVLRGGMLPHLALSYALQGAGRLAEAREVMHGFNAPISNASPSNTNVPQQAIALAREAELALTLDQVQSARMLLDQAQGLVATENYLAAPYVTAVSGLAYLIDGHAKQAKAAFEIALQRDPKDARALLGLGLAEIKLGNFQAGQQKLQAAHEADPGNALILTYLGRSQQQAGQTKDARASWRSAQLADPKDPTPWLYQAQTALQTNHPLEAQESLREAQARTVYRSVYRGENLLREDEQLLQANLAAIQQRLGMESIAFHTLADSASEKNAANLRNQADLLQGRRFGESARRSLLLQSLFGDRPGNLPSALDIYGDGAGQTGASTPQHGAVSSLSAQQASYNNYDELFGGRTTLEADVISGSKNTHGEQIRLGVGNDMLGLSLAGLQFKTDGFAPFGNLDNRVAQAIVQWRPLQSTQAFVSHQTFNSRHGETLFPADPGNAAAGLMLKDNSRITRLGLRHSLTDSSELRGLLSSQQTDQAVDYLDFVSGAPLGPGAPGSSSAHSAELQYRASGADHATQWGAQQTRAQIIFTGASDYTRIAQQLYAAWQQALSPHWQLDAQLGWGKIDNQDNTGGGNGNYLKRWLPKLGLVYTPDSGTHVRLAAWQGMGFGEIGGAALAPTSLAGILLSRPDDNKTNGMLVHAAALGADKQLSSAWLLDGQIQQRRTDLPIPPLSGQTLRRWQIDESRLALHWQPESHSWSVSLAYDQERFQAPPLSQYVTSDSVQEQRLRAQQLDIRWFVGAQWTANLALSHNLIDGALQTNWFATLLPYQSGFNQMDANLSWQLNRRGSLDAGVRNATDKRFQYTNIDTLNPRFSNGRMGYARLKLAW